MFSRSDFEKREEHHPLAWVGTGKATARASEAVYVSFPDRLAPRVAIAVNRRRFERLIALKEKRREKEKKSITRRFHCS